MDYAAKGITSQSPIDTGIRLATPWRRKEAYESSSYVALARQRRVNGRW
jgi:hypothetical protein